MQPPGKASEDYIIRGNSGIEKSILIGINSSGYKFSTNLPYYEYLSKAGTPKSFGFNLGFMVNLYNHQLSNSFSIGIGIIYFRIHEQYVYEKTVSSTASNIYNVTLHNHYLDIPLRLQYCFRTETWKPYIFIGSNSDILLKNKNHMTLTRTSSTGNELEELQPIATTSFPDVDESQHLYMLGLTFGGGIKHYTQKLPGYSFEINYTGIQGISKVFSLEGSAKSIFFTFGLIF